MTEEETDKPSDIVEHVVSANILLERESSDDYAQEWTTLLMQEKEEATLEDKVSVVIFRLKSEWLALSTSVFKSISEQGTIHRLPHYDASVILGVVNIRGQLRLCFALDNLLEVDGSDEEQEEQEDVYRMVVIGNEEETWVFPAEQVARIHHFERAEITNVPVTVTKSTANYFKGMFQWNDKSVGLIDEELLFYGLKRSLK